MTAPEVLARALYAQNCRDLARQAGIAAWQLAPPPAPVDRVAIVARVRERLLRAAA